MLINQVCVFVTDWPGCREIIIHHETGLLIPPRDPTALAESIMYLENNPIEYERLRHNLYEKTALQFSSKTVNSQTIDIYQLLLKP
jgi:glycosyltransferase involved in cell wall biosynthesis